MSKPWDERFWERVRKSDGCWEWTGRTHRTGYGELDATIGGKEKPWRAHRLSFFLANGYFPPSNIDVCHTCDNRRCVNPAHLYAGTRADNMRDCVVRGRVQRYNSSKTHCPHGHSLHDALVDKRRGWRRCRECQRLRNKINNARASRRHATLG